MWLGPGVQRSSPVRPGGSGATPAVRGPGRALPVLPGHVHVTPAEHRARPPQGHEPGEPLRHRCLGVAPAGVRRASPAPAVPHRPRLPPPPVGVRTGLLHPRVEGGDGGAGRVAAPHLRVPRTGPRLPGPRRLPGRLPVAIVVVLVVRFRIVRVAAEVESGDQHRHLEQQGDQVKWGFHIDDARSFFDVGVKILLEPNG